MIVQRRFAPIAVRFESESVSGFTGIYTMKVERLSMMFSAAMAIIYIK
jgi:hypothetical protein